jgi:uncharacterized membrane protein
VIGGWVSLALASAVLHAVWNAGIKRSEDKAACAAGVVAVAASVSGVAATWSAGLPRAALPATFASGLVEAAYFVTLSAALTAAPLKTAYPLIRGGGQLLAWPFAIFGLGEAVSSFHFAAGAVLAAGLGLGAAELPDRRGLTWVILCAVTIGMYPLTYKVALDAGASASALFAASMLISWPLQVAALGSGAGARLAASWRRERQVWLWAGVMCAASFLLFLGALQGGGAARASALRNVSVLVAWGLGVASGEGMSRRGAWGAAFVFAGASAVAWD